MKKFFEEFKKFITRGNVLDMSVGVIVGGAFTGIVNGLSNFILKPIINWIIALCVGKDGLTGAITPLSPAYVTDEAGNFVLDEAGNKVLDLANSIYIDWGSFVGAVINFFIIAFVLFCIVKFINGLRDGSIIDGGKLSKEDKKALRKLGIRLNDKASVDAYLADKAKKAEKAKEEAEEKARQERLANPTTEDLLKKILTVLEEK